jgi:hypothetical protein
MFYRTISSFVLLSLISIPAGFCQTNYKIHFGATGTIAAKLSFFDQDGKTTEHYKPIGAGQIGVALYIEDPNSLSFLLKSGIGYDIDQYLDNNKIGLEVGTDKCSFVFNPEILFPLSNRKFSIGAGIGFEYLLGTTLTLGTAINTAYYYGNMDEKERNLIPFINADFWYEASQKVWLGFGIKQPLLSSYYKNETMDFAGTSFNLKHQPTYFSASVYYQFF